MTTAKTLSRRLERAGDAVRRSTADRDALIVSAAEAGALSKREIARTVGLSHTAVQAILRRQAAG